MVWPLFPLTLDRNSAGSESAHRSDREEKKSRRCDSWHGRCCIESRYIRTQPLFPGDRRLHFFLPYILVEQMTVCVCVFKGGKTNSNKYKKIEQGNDKAEVYQWRRLRLILTASLSSS